MKNIRHIMLLLCLSLGAVSCQDFLKEEKTTSYTVDYLYGSPEGLKLALNATYALHKTQFYRATNYHASMMVPYRRSDLVSNGTTGTGSFWANWDPVYVVPANDQVRDLWNWNYTIVSRCNEIIQYARDMEQTPDLRQTVAEAECIRANAFLYLYSSFGRIWLNTEAVTPENVDEKKTYRPATKAEVMTQLKEDLDDAISVLGWDTEIGRWNQAAARHLRMNVAMHEEDWTEALKQLDAIVRSGKYDLVPLGEVFPDAADRNNKENYLVEQWSRNLGGTCDPTNGWGHYLAMLFIPYYSSQIVRSPALPEAERSSFENGGYTRGYIVPNPYLLGLYDQENDKRYTQWFIHKYKNTTPYPITYGKEVVQPGEYFPETKNGMIIYQMVSGCTKYKDTATRETTVEVRGFQDIIKLRLAEAFIWGAEAALKGGDETLAKQYFNKTWMRAGNPEFTGTLTMETIIEEHARELCFEGGRHFYLKRLGLAAEYVADHGGYPDLQGGNTYIACRANAKAHPEFVDLPIPVAQINIMGESFPQNPGY